MQYNFTVRKKDKGFQIIVSYKDGTRWRQKSKQGFKTQREAKLHAQKIIDELQSDISNPINIDMEQITLSQFFEIFISERINVAQNTLSTYRTALNVVKGLKEKRIVDITTADIRRHLSNSRYAPATLNMCRMVLIMLFDYAIHSYRIIRRNPCDGIKSIKNKQANEVVTFTNEELLRLDALHDTHYTYYMLFMFARYTGARYGEILGITWDDIDLNSGLITINKQWVKVLPNRFGFGPVKSKNSVRTIPIPPPLIDALYDYRLMNLDDRLFPFTHSHSNKANVILRKYIGQKTMHAFRHTYATKLLANGVDVKTVASLLGDTVNTVLDTYIHYTDDMRKKAAETLKNIAL